MPLSIRYVRSLEEVVESAVRFLETRPADLFARQHLVVPTAGAKAWLAAALAARLGASSENRGDGILANVPFAYPGTLSRLLEPAVGAGPLSTDRDAWAVDPLTFAVLEVVAGSKAFVTQIARSGGPLLAARRIADRFDHYHYRRPGMILAWEEGHAELGPEADADGKTVCTPLAPRDRWQFDLWRAVRERIGQPSPPARDRLASGPVAMAVFVAGLQSLSLHQIELLQRLARLPTASGEACAVEVLLVHPSPALAGVWAKAAPSPTPGIPPVRAESSATRSVTADPLVEAWLRGTRETQWLLASQGLEPTHESADDVEGLSTPPAADASLLARLQHTVASGTLPSVQDGMTAWQRTDHSLLIHRCHDLARQAEVIHDAILHAFDEIPDLATHEVVIVSPQIAELAPHLEATFQNTFKGTPALFGNINGEISLPLVIADRGIHEVSSGAELLARMLELVGSRCSVDAVMAVAAHPLVLAHRHLDDDDVDIWKRCIRRTHIRWGLDPDRRVRAGLEMPGLSAHSWRLGLERMILGAVVPDGDPEPVLGNVVPLPHVEAAEVTSLSALVTVLRIIDRLDAATREPQPVVVWCDRLEEALADLIGEESEELVTPAAELAALRKAALDGGSTPGVAVPFHDLEARHTRRLTAAVGRQPLMTGAITATSMIPLRGLPSRVICVAGFDESAITAAENDSDNLASRQDLLGDADARLELRRGLLDALLAARDRMVITCTGMDLKNNATLPLATPLAELVDFVGRHRVEPIERDGERHSPIEVFHPRHACSRRNFVPGKVVTSDKAWSHDHAARAAAEVLGQERPPSMVAATTIEPPQIIELDWLAEFVNDPLWPYVRKTLGISPWREDDLETPATLPLELEWQESRRLRNDYIDRLIATSDRSGLADVWAAAVRANGDVPVLGYGGDVIDRIVRFSDGLLAEAAAAGTPLEASLSETVHLQCDGCTLSGTIERWHPDTGSIVMVEPDGQKTESGAFTRAKARAIAQLLAARADGLAAEQVLIFSERDAWTPGITDKKGRPISPAIVRVVRLDEAIGASRARQLLAALVGLYRQAAIRPHGLFGSTAAKLAEGREEAAKAFATCIGGQRYAQSKEAVIYGLHPDFDDVFPEDDGRRPFFDSLSSLAAAPYNRSTKVYVYSPSQPA
jgi:exodeoxyribonuclease V gamma subunit